MMLQMQPLDVPERHVGAQVQVMKDGEFLESLVESFCRDQFRAYSEVGESSWEHFVQLNYVYI